MTGVQTCALPIYGVIAIVDFNPREDRIIIPLNPHQLAGDVSVEPTNGGEYAFRLKSNDQYFVRVTWAPPDEIFGDEIGRASCRERV